MQQSSSLSTKSYNSGIVYEQDKKSLGGVNWISVINFLENQYTKSSILEKQWFLQKKLLNEEILKLKNELTSVQRLNCNLNNRIKLLQNTLKKQKLLKQSNPKQQIFQQTKNIKEIQKYFQKNGWSLNQKPSNNQQNSHKQFLNKVLDQVGINFGKIQQKCRKMSFASVDNDKSQRKDTTQKFQNLINQINKVKISNKIKINAHLDSVRGIFITKNNSNQNLLMSVSQDCLVKLWSIDSKNKQNQAIQPVSCLRQHTGQLFTIDGGSINEGTNDLALFTAGTQEYVKVWYTELKQKNQDIKCVGSFLNQKHQSTEQSHQLENQIIWNLKYKNKRLLTSASDGVVRLFSTSFHNNQNQIKSDVKFIKGFSQKGYIQTVIDWVGQGGFLAACSNSPKIHLWDIEKVKITQKYLYQIDKPKQDKNNLKKDINFATLFQINSLKYHSDFKLIYTGCEDKSIRIFSYDESKIIKKIDSGINDSVNCIEFYKNNLIVAGCQNGSLKIWDRRTYRLLIDEQGHKTKYDEGILCLKTTEDGIFSGGADGIINFYSI